MEISLGTFLPTRPGPSIAPPPGPRDRLQPAKKKDIEDTDRKPSWFGQYMQRLPKHLNMKRRVYGLGLQKSRDNLKG